MKQKITYRICEMAFSIGKTMHIPQELRIRSRGTERHSASN